MDRFLLRFAGRRVCLACVEMSALFFGERPLVFCSYRNIIAGVIGRVSRRLLVNKKC